MEPSGMAAQRIQSSNSASSRPALGASSHKLHVEPGGPIPQAVFSFNAADIPQTAEITPPLDTPQSAGSHTVSYVRSGTPFSATRPEKSISDDSPQNGNLTHDDHRVEYRCWIAMRSRCNNPKDHRYRWYGARGIRVCERWGSFAAFLADVGPRTSPVHTIDRFPDNDGDYEPGNVRWATRSEQQQNTRQTRKLTHGGVTASLSEWARRLGIRAESLRQRLDIHPVETALGPPSLSPSRRLAPACYKSARSASGYKGVYAAGHRWAAQIKDGGKLAYLGLYNTPEEAAEVYNRRAVELWGDYARLNVIPQRASQEAT
jgi:hypothetical protein